ncbi:hypothetical protein QE152_g8618 [Popillia japonica]|uniref:Uncharacterized protein n=1 Tax=Popillia japonica TaxID=7064 RepID=A0AAW1M3E4_POPJA
MPYSDMVCNSLTPALQYFPGHGDTTWYQQDSATADMAQLSITTVSELFPACPLSQYGDFAWSPGPLDLTLMEFFFWGYLKSGLYGNPLVNIEKLKQRICDEITKIPTAICQSTFQ